jgi:hypothetical protein
MAANISMNTYNESKQYDKVILQQGVPITDYDYNETQDIIRGRLRNIVTDLIGNGAVEDGWKIIGTGATNDFTIKAGVVYQGGYRVSLGADATAILSFGLTLTTPTVNRVDKVYMDIYEIEIDAVADPGIRHQKFQAASIEPTRRIKVKADLKVAEGGSIPANGNGHYYFWLCDINRLANNAVITAAMIVDQRVMAGVVPRFNTEKGHDHDGINSKKVAAGNILFADTANKFTATDIESAILELYNDPRFFTVAQKGDLTDGSDTALHYHSSDRNWNNITNKPTYFASAPHNHDDRYFTETEVGATTGTSGASITGVSTISGITAANVQDALEALKSLIDGKALASHIHDDRYYTETELSSVTVGSSGATKIKISSISGLNATHVQAALEALKNLIDNLSSATHNHDDRYYTQTQMASYSGTTGAKLVGGAVSGITGTNVQDILNNLKAYIDSKANNNHTHTVSQITDFAHTHDDRYYTETEISATTSGYSGAKLIGVTAISGLSGSNVQTVLESIKTLLNGKSDNGHVHAGSAITSMVSNSDMVDGKHATDFALVSHAHTGYLPTTGGTETGDVNTTASLLFNNKFKLFYNATTNSFDIDYVG